MNRLEVFKSIDLGALIDKCDETREVVMVWNSEGQLQLVSNISSQPNTFAIDYGVRSAIKEGRVIGVLHSHLPSMSPKLSPQDIVFADFYGVDIACLHCATLHTDYFSPFLHHPYPLEINNLLTFQDRRYEQFRSDCYRFVENCLSFAGYQLPLYPRSSELYQFDENFQLGDLATSTGWFLSSNQDFTATEDGDLIILNFDNTSHHFGLSINSKVVCISANGVRAFSHRMVKAYGTHIYKLIKPLGTKERVKLREVLEYMGF